MLTVGDMQNFFFGGGGLVSLCAPLPRCQAHLGSVGGYRVVEVSTSDPDSRHPRISSVFLFPGGHCQSVPNYRPRTW